MNAFNDLTDILKSVNQKNPWQGTPFEDFYNYPPKTKGAIGEEITKSILIKNGNSVTDRVNSGHDCIVNGIKTEIKFSLATDRNPNKEFTFNHIGLHKDWEQIIFVGICHDGEIISATFTKTNLPMHLFSHQQGGNKSSNDDYMITGEKSKMLFSTP